MKKVVSKIKQKIKNKYQTYRCRKLKNKTIIIHTLGKVGSSTIYQALKKVSPWRNIFHTHFLSNEWLNVRLKEGNHYESNIRAAEKVFAFMKKYPNNKKYIISLVREPVSREVSNFMENPGNFIVGEILTYSISDLKKVYLNKLNYDYTLEWFDSEFFNYTGFDVYAKPFDKEKGYSIYHHNDFEILIIKLETLNKCYNNAMKAFLGLSLKLEASENQSSQKKISGIYSELKKSIKFTEAQLNKVYGHKYISHFYTLDEINSFKEKWS